MTDITFRLLPIDWTAVAAVAGILQATVTAFLVISVWYAKSSLEESKNSRAADILIWAASQMDGVKEDILLLEAADSDFRNWSQKENSAAFQVTIRFQRLGYMARHNLIDKNHFRRMWGRDFVRLWAILSDWVMDLRLARGEPVRVEDGAFSRVDFQLLAEEFSRSENT